MEDIQLIITLAGKGNDPLPALLKEIFGNQEIFAQPGMCILKIANGVIIQLYSTGAQPPAYITDVQQPILAFKVNNLVKSIATIEAQGGVLLENVTDSCTGFSFAYLQLSDGIVVGCFQ